ncbi:MAG TPA: TIGR03118 family protein [Chitinophagaceae bacterium]|nr:TIGR03118 family protein [Chitinophagaceae bacterium]
MGKILSKAAYPAFALVLLTVIFSCQKNVEKTIAANEEIATKAIPPQELKDFVQVNLVGDNDEYNPAHIDPNMVNGWGISFPASGPAWVSAEGTGKTGIYNGEGVAAGISPVSIPGTGTSTVGHPTGQVSNGTTDFKLPNGNPARFIFAGADGVISGWNGGTTAIKKVDDGPDASYFGIALANDRGNNFLYVANFAEKKIDVYDKDWAEVSKPFTDPDLPPDYSPFNIQNIGGQLFVMYSKLGDDGDEVVSPGNGYVDIYNPDGSLMKRFISRGQLNAPWGVAKAPAGFWGEGSSTSDVFLVGNFGDGHINAYADDGNFLGQLRQHGVPIEIEGLWGIAFAPSTSTALNHNWLFFAAGPDDEEHGLFGYIKK